MRTSKNYWWQEGAACQRIPTGFEDAEFFPENRRSPGAKLAKQFCGVCPIRMRCLEWALTHDERHGIWGGTDPEERKWLANPTADMENTDATTG